MCGWITERKARTHDGGCANSGQTSSIALTSWALHLVDNSHALDYTPPRESVEATKDTSWTPEVTPPEIGISLDRIIPEYIL